MFIVASVWTNRFVGGMLFKDLVYKIGLQAKEEQPIIVLVWHHNTLLHWRNTRLYHLAILAQYRAVYFPEHGRHHIWASQEGVPGGRKGAPPSHRYHNHQLWGWYCHHHYIVNYHHMNHCYCNHHHMVVNKSLTKNCLSLQIALLIEKYFNFCTDLADELF